ncbi:MAG: hypothetical protein MUW56_03210 [Chryseobacterium sp.]|uniref:hypothetical protein n=1 Tax=Chryseobacterium sp. TaxID=1871047 RepID=UPI0025C364F2|nr:hypothetical protein [Chryseobacterium sp.]MCJ7932656.1 hypothetical protein [Chryseobacterium sp.]
MKNKKLKTLLHRPDIKKVKSQQHIVITGGYSVISSSSAATDCCYQYFNDNPVCSDNMCWSFQ